MSFFSPSGSYLKDARSNTPRVENKVINNPAPVTKPTEPMSVGRQLARKTSTFLRDFIELSGIGRRKTDDETYFRSRGM